MFLTNQQAVTFGSRLSALFPDAAIFYASPANQRAALEIVTEVIADLLSKASPANPESLIKSNVIPLDNTTTIYHTNAIDNDTPVILGVMLLCTAVDANMGYPVGTEINAVGSLFFYGSPAGNLYPQTFVISSDIAVNVYVPLVGGETNWFMIPIGGTNPINPTSFNNFALKVYYI